jgi:hypothetical protein
VNSFVSNILTLLRFFPALGKDGKMTVVGTVCLDNSGLTMFQELRVQRKGPFIAENAMIEIVQVRMNLA